MSPRTKIQLEALRKEKKQLIRETALRLFAEKGYAIASISQIAIEAGISKGLMYNYFESKEELLEDLINYGFDSILALFDPNHDGVLEQDEMEYFIRQCVQTIKDHRLFWKFYFQVSMQPDVYSKVEKKILELYNPVMIMATDYFKKMGFKNPSMEALIFGTIIDGMTLDYVMSPDLFPIDAMVEELVTRYCNTKQK